MTSDEIIRAADAAQYRREAMPSGATQGPVVTLLNATPDPLGSIAALCGIYKGRVVRSLGSVTNDERREAFEDMMKTELSGPLESVLFHFLIEGMSRATTHQGVRQRKAFFAQESLRFAVADDWAHEIPLPPSLAGLAEDDPKVRVWRKALVGVEDSYEALIAAGMPAEEARGLLPHAITTRYHWVVDLRGLLIEAGKRTCTQAQFEWRQIFGGVAKALRDYGGVFSRMDDEWQYALIADHIRPVCYAKGACTFMASMDRGCTIRERVNANAKAQRPSSEWGTDLEKDMCGSDSDCPGGCSMEQTYTIVKAIHPVEWAADPGAART